MQICLYIPKRYSNNQKAAFLRAVKQTCATALGSTPKDVRCYVRECLEADLCSDAKDSVLAFVYMRGKDMRRNYHDVGQGIETACLSELGEALKTSVIFRERDYPNLASGGKLAK